MINDNVSEIIDNASCYTINSPTSIYSYSGNIRRTYTLMGGSWYQTAQSNYNTIPSGAYCVSYSTIQNIASYEYMSPVYSFMALIVSLFILLFAFWLLFRSFVRRRL